MGHETKPEYTNWRNNSYMNQHRNWGKKLYCADADCLEFDGQGNLKAIIELKHGWEDEIDLDSYQFPALKKLAGVQSVPLFCVAYFPPGYDAYTGQERLFGDHWSFYVVPANGYANALLDCPTQMTEREWVTLLYQLREIPVPADLELDNTPIKVRLPTIAA